MRLLAGA